MTSHELRGHAHYSYGRFNWDATDFSHDDFRTGLTALHWQPLGAAPEWNDVFHFEQQAAPSQLASPTMAQEIAFISGVNADGTVAATSFDTWNGNNPAAYTGPAGVAKFGKPVADRAGGTVKFYFDTASHWTAGEKAVMSACLKLWSDLANIKFVATANQSAAQITFQRGHDGSAYTDPHYSGASNAGRIGGAQLYHMDHATISLDTSVPGFGPIDGNFGTIGGYVWETIIHEEGHALGLGHGGAYNGDDNPRTQQFSAYDTRLWSLMSYIEPTENAKYSAQYPVKGTDWGVSADGYGNDPTTPMMLDIKAIQSLYGASKSSAFAGGQTFGFHCNIADVTAQFYNFAINTDPVVTIWDSGGHNKLDLSGFATASNVNLNSGTFSSCDGKINNLGIADGTVINTAVTGSGRDTIHGNAGGNVLKSGSGNDHLIGSGGADHLIAGNGVDKLDGGMGADRLNGGANADTFIYESASNSTGAKFDKIMGFDGAADKIDVWFKVVGAQSDYHTGSVSKAAMDTDLTRILTASHLGRYHFALLTPKRGDEAGHTFLVIDANGHAGYQAGQDLVIDVTGGTHLASLHASHFI